MISPCANGLFASDAKAAFELITVAPADCRTDHVDAVVLGWRSSAERIAREVRQQGYKGALIAALAKPSSADVVSALSSGCDDAQRFPTEPSELAVRISAIRRRIEGALTSSTIIKVGRLEIGRDGSDPRIDGKPLKVSPNCAKVLAIVAESPHPVPLARIALALYRGDPPPSKTVNTYLCMLRAIMSVATGEDRWLKRHDGGYVLYRP
ncbi:hypothetical protein [Azospirillum sp.]|uniref:response regulator transcription factor n=1 Tax=Azospirillum sp. TaxID=34012 RepID=UPI002D4E9F8D|nr:hypothetical protein [Azospirillum sp.]HYD69231.1 hypothetical protein [Azospirillum sp.]